MDMLQDAAVVHELKGYQAMVRTEWYNFARVLKKYPDVFPQKYISQPLFNNYYA